MATGEQPELETDPRFPSGPWVGFFLQKVIPGRHRMELRLTFLGGQMTGEGRDFVGAFAIRGRYLLADGTCHWTKQYLGKHDVFYRGFNEGKGIWGTWEIAKDRLRGGFHIWPEGMPDPSGSHLTEAAELPRYVEDSIDVTEPLVVPIGSSRRGHGGEMDSCGRERYLDPFGWRAPAPWWNRQTLRT